MSRFSKETYCAMFDALLSEELYFNSSFASEINIKRAMKKVLGTAIKHELIKRYSSMVLDEDLNVHFLIVDPDGDEFSLTLYYGK